MFYYGLDFHDLAPNFVLISVFIVVCKAFLRIKPHFGLWLRIFCVKPKIVSGQQVECGGAMVGKMPNITWLDGSFVETVKGWQSGWFYITEPRDTNSVAAPEFRSGIPMRLISWKEKGLSWGSSVELDGLQKCIMNTASKMLKLVNIVQVMLVRRILPCQRHVFNLWEFVPAEHQTLQELYGMTHKDAWKVLFKASEIPPPTSEDHGFHVTRLPHLVSFLTITRCTFPSILMGGF